MLVTCPECGAKISSEANPCVRCGLPGAGELSKEFCEYFAKEKDGTPYHYDFLCRGCGLSGPKGKYNMPMKTEIVKRKEAAGWLVRVVVKCPGCGKIQVVNDDAVPWGYA